MLSLAIT